MDSKISLKKNLLRWISIPVVIGALMVSVLSFAFTWHEIEEIYDAQLVHSAKVLLQMTEQAVLVDNKSEIMLGEENPNLMHEYENKTAFRIWYKDRLVTQSKSADKFREKETEGFTSRKINGKRWRIFTFSDPKTSLSIETSERLAIRYELITQLMYSQMIPIILFIPFILAAIWIGTNRSLLPLINISNAVDSRHADDLSEIKIDHVPLEIRPLTLAMNRLLDRLLESFRREREFTDHAAHELRTPLAALKTQSQVLMKKSAHAPELQEGFENLTATIDRSTNLIEQLLSFARVQNAQIILSEINLSDCLFQVVRDLQPLADSKEQKLNLNIAENVIIDGNSDALYLLFKNLLDNAIKYSPAGSEIFVGLSKEGHIEIRDTGPGIPSQDKERVFNRFVRIDKSGQIGSGLGLSIVDWIANTHGIKIHLEDNSPSGLKVKMECSLKK